MNPILNRLRIEAEEFFTSPEGVALSKNIRTSLLFPARFVGDHEGVARWHFHRFVMGAADEHAIAGWSYVMEGRARAARKAARELEVALAALNRKKTA